MTPWFLAVSPLDLSGPEFLSFYFWALVAALLGVAIWKRVLNRSRNQAPPPLPQEIDPHELAWLRGGMPDLVHLMGVELLQRGFLQNRQGGPGVAANPAQAGRLRELTPGAAALVGIFDRTWKRKQILREGSVALWTDAQTYQDHAQEHGFLYPTAARRQVRLLGWALILIFLGLGYAKIHVALSRGHHNVGLLVFLMIVAFCGLLIAMRLPRLSQRGKRYLLQAQSALSQLRPELAIMAREGDPRLLLGVAAFGVGVLQVSQYSAYHHILSTDTLQGSSRLRPGSTADNSGGSCSGGNSCSGSGGSSCSGGNSCSGSGGSSCSGGSSSSDSGGSSSSDSGGSSSSDSGGSSCSSSSGSSCGGCSSSSSSD